MNKLIKELKELIEKYPNDMQLGEVIREYIKALKSKWFRGRNETQRHTRGDHNGIDRTEYH